MLQIHCPFCGNRNEDEFHYIGDGGQRIMLQQPLDTVAYAAHLYMRPNPAGPVKEYWHHRYGCQTIFFVWRDTKTHDMAH